MLHLVEDLDRVAPNLVPRVFRLFGQRGNAGKTLGPFNRFFLLAMPFLTEVENQNTSPGSHKASAHTQEPMKMQSLLFHWLLGMSGS